MALTLLSALAWLAPRAAHTSASAQSGESLFIRKISIKANDVVYSPATSMLYASVPSSAGPGGNTITPVNPSTGEVGTPVFIGSEPNRLAISGEGNTLYVGLDGAFSVRRFEVQTQTPGLQFSLGSDSHLGAYVVSDMAVAPGEPGTVAVARHYRGVSPPGAGVAIFENGVQRPKTGVGHSAGADYLAYSATATKLYGGGFYDGLRTMTIDSTGVASTTYATNSVGALIKLAGGLVFGSAGKVMNPDTGALLGTFTGASGNAFVPDAAAGRVYYLVRDNYNSSTLTLKAYDTTTFLPVGSQTITGVTGEPTKLVRWGLNGLAFRTSNGEVYAIQTSLIPSGAAIPTPTPTPTSTPTPTPTPAAAFVRQLPILTNSLAYNPERQAIYVSLPSNAAASGNSVAQINTSTGAVESPIFVGSEPKRMAFSDDGQTMYVGLQGAAAVRRVDLQTSTPGLQFGLGADSYSGAYFPDYLAVMPGSPDTVAVSRTGGSYSGGGTAIYDNGVQRPQVAGSGFLQFGLTASRLYAGGGPVQKLAVAATGLTSAGTIQAGRGGTTSFFDRSRGLLFTSGGDVIDPEAGAILGQFTGLNYNTLMAVDSAAGRVYFLTGDSFSSSTWKLIAYDMNTFLPLGYANLTGIVGEPSDLVRWGANGLAFRTGPSYYSSSTEGRVVLIQTSLVDGSLAVPTPTPTPTATPTPTPSYVPTFVRKVSLPAGDVVYNDATQSLYASVASSAGTGGNSITPINPSTGATGTPVFVGSEPGRLALGDDGKTLYVYLEGSKNMRRFDLQTQAPGIQFSVGTQTPADFEVMPGSPQSIAVSPGVNFSTGPTVYDDGVARPKYGGSGNNLFFYAVLPIEFGATPSVLYGYDSYSSGFELVKFTIDNTGVTTAAVTNNLLSGYSTDIKFAGGLIYSSSGRVVDPEAKQLVGTFNQAGGVFTVDTALGRIFYLTGDGYSGSNKVLKAYDLNTFLPLGSVTVPNVTGNPTRMVRWGANGLAVRTAGSNFGSSNNDGGVFIIQSALVSNTQPVPTGVALASDRVSAGEWSSTLAFTVTRTGDVSAPTAVSYATSDGTAAAGSDYTAASGTITFAAGELTKTFNVTIRQDNVYEGAETFTVTLSDPTGGAVLSGPASALVTIGDDESRPFVSISDVRVTEGHTGTTDAQFLVSLSNASVETVTVNYTTGDGTASSASDFVANSGTLTFAPLTTSQLVKVKVNGDYSIESDETFIVTLSGAVNSSLSRSQATGTIANDDAAGRFQFAGPSYGHPEDGGSVTITVNRVSGLSGAASVNYATTGGTATAGTDYTAVSGTLNFAEGESSKTFSVPLIADTTNEPSETVVMSLSSPTGGALLGVPTSTTLTIINDDQPTYQFTSAFYEANEGAGQVVLTVTRGGDPSMDVSVNYTTADATATEISDYTLTLGTLRFAPGETQKTITVLVTNDALGEVDETFLVNLSGHTSGALGVPATATVTIHSDETTTGPNPVGGGFDPQFFVRQHYHDFLNREPDAGGLAHWASVADNCGETDLLVCRINVSGAFFLSIEFKETGYLVERTYKAAYGDALGSSALGGTAHTLTVPAVRLREFMADTQRIGQGVVVLAPGWEEHLEANKTAFFQEFVQRLRFLNDFPAALTPAQFVDQLNQRAGNPLDAAERQSLVNELTANNTTAGRASALRKVSEDATLADAEKNRAFVLMQYFGYLRRNPNEGQDTDYTGYEFWLGNLEKFGGNFVHAELVKAFILSAEYRQRFGQ
ncbi:MAG TPA: Calx-beta domain-containing protein [Pyrinomonadaceae bacterium]|nr:Calx-beta domain-containing protein [Pyrinomonadaceae bacterium]